MKKEFYTILFLTVCIYSCMSDNPRVMINNNSGYNIDSLIVGVSNSIPTVITNIKKSTTKSGKIQFHSQLKGDGNYSLEIYFEDKKIRKEFFGYYSNGKSLNNEFKINIEKDTTTILLN